MHQLFTANLESFINGNGLTVRFSVSRAHIVIAARQPAFELHACLFHRCRTAAAVSR